MTPFRCFGGNGSDLGTVRQLHVTSFEGFVKEVLGEPIILNVTRAQFQALEKKRRNEIKRVAYVTPACFSNSHRLHENATEFHLIALDIDASADGACPAKPFVDNPDLLHQQLAGLRFAAYKTASSTPTAPRLRIFVEADGLPIDLYGRAVHTIAEMLGLPVVTKESLVVVQPMFLPTIFRDDDVLNPEFHPVIASATKGEALTADDVSEAPTQETLPLNDPRKAVYSIDGDELDYLRPQVEGVELDDAKEALATLDPDMTYPEWLEVAAALRHQFPGEPEATLAYELFDEWSATGAKYEDSDDTMAKWKSLRATPKGRAPVTIRTLLHKAQENGWSSAKLTAKCYASTLRWIIDEARLGSELMAEGVKRIAATPLLSSMERNTLLGALQDALKEHKLKITRAELKKELSKLERQGTKLEAPKVTPDSQLPMWCRGMVYVAKQNEFYHRSSNRDLKPEAFDACYNAFLTEPDSPNGKPAMLARDFALNMAKIPRVDNYRYDPSAPDQAFIIEGKLKFVNTYIPTYPEPVPDKAQEAGDILMEHVCLLIREPEYQQTLIDWMAYQVQNPGVKVRWCVVLQGAEGCGKTALAESLAAALGRTHVNVLDGYIMMRDMYNGWAMGAQIVALEEVRIVGHNRHEIMNKLKPCISNDRLSIRSPYKALIQTPNNVNYMIFTNHHDSLAISENDRRYFVVNSAIQSKREAEAIGTEYFDRLFAMLKDNAGGLRAWLLEWPVSKGFNPNGHAPVTHYLGDLRQASRTPLTSAVLDAITDGDHALIRTDLLSTRALRTVLDTMNVPGYTDQTLAGCLRELDFTQLGRVRLDDGRHYLWTKRNSRGPADAEAGAKLARQRLKQSNAEEVEQLLG